MLQYQFDLTDALHITFNLLVKTYSTFCEEYVHLDMRPPAKELFPIKYLESEVSAGFNRDSKGFLTVRFELSLLKDFQGNVYRFDDSKPFQSDSVLRIFLLPCTYDLCEGLFALPMGSL